MSSPPPTTAAAFTVHVNGERFDYDRSSVPSVSTTLAAFLRRGPPLLTGTKVGCGEGGCGACTVAVRYPFFCRTCVSSRGFKPALTGYWRLAFEPVLLNHIVHDDLVSECPEVEVLLRHCLFDGHWGISVPTCASSPTVT
jgi:hypothetical protein